MFDRGMIHRQTKKKTGPTAYRPIADSATDPESIVLKPIKTVDVDVDQVTRRGPVEGKPCYFFCDTYPMPPCQL